MKKLLALSAGRLNGNTEVLLKEALMGAEEVGVAVSLIRLHELELRPCASCSPPCAVQHKGPDCCVIKDDGAWLMKEFLDCDGIILGSPVFSLTPTGLFMTMRDRITGSKVDINLQKARGLVYDERLYKRRVGGLISVGGAKLDEWTALGLPVMHTMLFSSQTRVVDQIDAHQVASLGAASLDDALLARCHELGRHVAQAMLMPFDEVQWMGDQGDICPICHRSVMVMEPGKAEVHCAVCGTKGKIVPDGAGYTVQFELEDLAYSVHREAGLKRHTDEIMDVLKNHFLPRKDEVPGRMEKYQTYTECIVRPPKKQA